MCTKPQATYRTSDPAGSTMVFRAERLENVMLARLLVLLIAVMLAPAVYGASIVTSGTGLAGATTARDSFRTALGGGAIAGANGSFGGVRREINWDGVPDASATPNDLPADFFNVGIAARRRLLDAGKRAAGQRQRWSDTRPFRQHQRHLRDDICRIFGAAPLHVQSGATSWTSTSLFPEPGRQRRSPASVRSSRMSTTPTRRRSSTSPRTMQPRQVLRSGRRLRPVVSRDCLRRRRTDRARSHHLGQHGPWPDLTPRRRWMSWSWTISCIRSHGVRSRRL